MKKTLLLVGILLTLTASVAMGAGISVAWGNYCWSDEGSSNSLSWACNSNTNTNIRMTCSFKPAEAHSDFCAVGVYMDGMTEEAAVPDWWKMGDTESGDCRSNLITLSADGSFSTACIDPWQGLGGGGIGLYNWYDSPSPRMHVNAAYAVADPVPTESEVEYFAVQFRISGTKTVNSCTGCLTKAAWGLARIEVAYLSATQDEVLTTPYSGGNQCLMWQGSTLTCGEVPARNTTWGQVKSLYR